MTKTRNIVTCIVLISMLCGCTAAIIGAVTVTSIHVATDKRSVGEQVDDKTIGLKIREKLYTDPELRKKTHISVTSMNGIVLLTGQAPTPALRNKVLVIARNTPEVRQVVDQIKLEGKTTLTSRANDSYISAKVKTKLWAETKLDATRVKVLTENSNVYLMGLVTQEEAEAATNVARTVGGVVKVIKVFEYIN